METKHHVGTAACTALVIASMIGIGVFTSLGFQVAVLPSGFVILLLWVIGGVLAMCGALSYAEVGLALPRSGGEYHFLSRIFHPAMGCGAGVVSIVAGFAGPAAIAASAIGKYASVAFPDAGDMKWLPPLAVLVVAIPHLIHLSAGSVFQIVFTSLKICLILVLIAAGVLSGEVQPISFAPAPGDWKLIFGTPFAVSLMWVMYSYLGWNAVVYILGEIRDRTRAVRISITVGTLVVAVLYILLNWVFLRVAPLEDLAGKMEPAGVAATHMFGAPGGRLMSGLIAFGLISALSALMWLWPRVMATMGEDLRPLRWFAQRSATGVPVRAMSVQILLVFTLLTTASFNAIVLYTQFTLTLCGFLVVLGLIILRVREPGLARPFRVPFYPLTPLLFLGITLFTMVQTFRQQPAESAWGLATVALGGLLYFVSRLRRSPGSPQG